MKINLRWLIQAIAFIGCIFFFLQIWERSKQLLLSTDISDFIFISANGFAFLICFFVMGLTSYIKQKNNGTLKNRIPLFEKVLVKLGLAE